MPGLTVLVILNRRRFVSDIGISCINIYARIQFYKHYLTRRLIQHWREQVNHRKIKNILGCFRRRSLSYAYEMLKTLRKVSPVSELIKTAVISGERLLN